MVKLKEEFDYKSLCRRLDIELDKLIAENERQQKEFEDEVARIRIEAQNHVAEAERKYIKALEVWFFRFISLSYSCVLYINYLRITLLYVYS